MTDAQRVLFITLHFPPSRDIGAHACEQIARYFPLHGWHPVVLTRPKCCIEWLDPNYKRAFPGTIVEVAPLPHPLALYKRLRKVEGHLSSAARGQARTPVSPRDTIRRWMLSLLQMPDVYTGWLLPATLAGLRTIRRERIAHIISSGPYWTNHLVGLTLKWLTGLPWTAHYRDPWNQQPQTKPVSWLSNKIERLLESLVVRSADSIVCVTQTHADLLRSNKVVVIPNGYDGEEWDAIQPSMRDKFVITYPGTFSMGTRTPRPLFRAVRELIDRGEVDAEHLQVDLFGDCEIAEGMSVREMAAHYRLNVTVGGHRSRPETLEHIASSNLLLLLAEGWALQIPGKTYEYLRAGKPILALTGEGALADLLRRTGGAFVVDPNDHSAIVAAIRATYRAWKKNRGAPAPSPAKSAAGGGGASLDSLVASFDRRQLAGRFTSLFSLPHADRVDVEVLGVRRDAQRVLTGR